MFLCFFFYTQKLNGKSIYHQIYWKKHSQSNIQWLRLQALVPMHNINSVSSVNKFIKSLFVASFSIVYTSMPQDSSSLTIWLRKRIRITKSTIKFGFALLYLTCSTNFCFIYLLPFILSGIVFTYLPVCFQVSCARIYSTGNRCYKSKCHSFGRDFSNMYVRMYVYM